MTESRQYAIMLEKKLIDEFKDLFREKLGYVPIVVTEVETKQYSIPIMSLDQLAEYFTPFLPFQYGKRLALPSKSRKRELVELRMMFCYLARSMRYTLDTVGNFLGGRDHTTIMHNVSTFLNLMETCDEFRIRFSDILHYIKENHESSVMDQPDPTQRESEPAILP